MLDELQIDLNEFISQKVKDNIFSLEEEITELKKRNNTQAKELDIIRTERKKYENSLTLLTYIQRNFSNIKETTEEDEWHGSKKENQYNYIEKILLNIFNIKQEQNGWYCHRNDGTLVTHLAINYYHNKDIVINLLNVLLPENNSIYDNNTTYIISSIKNFKMPYDYDKQDILKFVKNPHRCTNGEYFGINKYWIDYGATKDKNTPYDLLMRNPHILDEDVFEIILEKLRCKNQYSEHYLLYVLPKYNHLLSKEHIELMGECLLNIPKTFFKYDTIKDFIITNILKFNNKTLDYLYQFIGIANYHEQIYWGCFPVEYQMKYLKDSKTIDILKMLTERNCKWTLEEQEKFLREYLNEKERKEKDWNDFDSCSENCKDKQCLEKPESSSLIAPVVSR